MDEFEQALGVDDGQGRLSSCNPWSHKELDTTEWLNWIHEEHILEINLWIDMRLELKVKGGNTEERISLGDI